MGAIDSSIHLNVALDPFLGPVLDMTAEQETQILSLRNVLALSLIPWFSGAWHGGDSRVTMVMVARLVLLHLSIVTVGRDCQGDSFLS